MAAARMVRPLLSQELIMETIVIAGRAFKGAKNSTMEHDVFVQGMIAKAKLGRLEMLAGETPDDFALRIYRRVAFSSDVFLLLGSILFPADLPAAEWTPQIAEDTAQFLRKLTDEQDKKIVQGQIIGAIMGFFQKGLAYSVISPSFSRRVTSVQPAKIVPTEAQKTSESGEMSSEQ
jgi:hypothetical protein